MNLPIWFTVGGALLIVMALSGSMLSRMPVSTAMFYLLAGLAIGPIGLGLAAPDLFRQAAWLEHLTEVIVLLSLFTSGMKMSLGVRDRRWSAPLRLALSGMLVTVALITAVGVGLLGLPLGAALLLGGILAPTDPVLATEVQVDHPADRDQLRFALTGEGGLNDGTAAPVVLLGLGLLGVHDMGAAGWRWLAVDVLWASGAAIAIGASLGAGLGHLVLHLRRRHHEATGYENFLALGLIGLAYGLAVLAQAYGFLAVFAAGLALRHAARSGSGAPAEAAPGDTTPGDTTPGDTTPVEITPVDITPAEATPSVAAPIDAAAAGAAHLQDTALGTVPARAAQLATDPQHAPAYMAHAVLSFNEQIDRIGEMVGVVTLGLLLWSVPWSGAAWWFVPLMLLGVRPLAVQVALAGSRVAPAQRRLIGWFGIRGIGSLFYLAYALNHGLPARHASTLAALTVAVVVSSILLHGMSVTPLMARYRRRRRPITRL